MRNDMPGQPAKDKKWVSSLLKRELIKKLDKLAAFRKTTRTAVISSLLDEGVSDIVLTAKDYEEISKEMQRRH